MANMRIFQNRVLEFLLDAPTPVVAEYDQWGSIDTEAVQRAQLMVHVLMLANGVHPENRRRVREQVTILRLSWVTTQFRLHPTIFCAISLENFQNRVPARVADAVRQQDDLEPSFRDLEMAVNLHRGLHLAEESYHPLELYAVWHDEHFVQRAPGDVSRRWRRM
jgi:hypothetical protein